MKDTNPISLIEFVNTFQFLLSYLTWFLVFRHKAFQFTCSQINPFFHTISPAVYISGQSLSLDNSIFSDLIFYFIL